MSERLWKFMGGVVLLWTAINLWHYGHRRQTPVSVPSAVVGDARESLSRADVEGVPPFAKVTVVAFSDYGCDVCRRLDAMMEALLKRHSPALRMEWRHLPRSRTRGARPAALAAVCAGMQGRAEEMHRLLFRYGRALAAADWKGLALEAGVADPDELSRCMGGPSARAVLDQDFAMADRIGTETVPTVVVNGAVYKGLPSDLERIIDQLLTQP